MERATLIEVLGCLVLCSGTAWSQRVDIGRQGRNFDFSNAPQTRVVRMGDSMPQTCQEGELFFLRTASPGTNLRACVAGGIWVTLAGGGGASLQILNDGTAVGSRESINLVAGAGAGITCADDGGNNRVTCTFQLDSSVLNTSYVQLGTGNTYAAGFVQDFSAAQLRLPTAAALQPTVSGRIGYDTNTDTLSIGRNGVNRALALQRIDSQPLAIARTNASAPGTSLNLLAKLNSSGEAVTPAAGDADLVVGIVTAGAGTSGSATIATHGVALCTADNATTIGNFVQVGTAVGGRCRDAGSAYPASGQVIGVWLSSVSAGAAGNVLLLGTGQRSAAAAVTSVFGRSGAVTGATGDYQASQILSTPAGNLSSVNVQSAIQELDNEKFSVQTILLPAESIAAGATGFLAPGAAAQSAAEAERQVLAPQDLTLSRLYFRTSSPQPASGALTCTLRANNTDTALAVTIPANAAAGVYSNTTDSATVTAGQAYGVRCVNGASAASAGLRSVAWRVQ